jgi:hypothetical protein
MVFNSHPLLINYRSTELRALSSDSDGVLHISVISNGIHIELFLTAHYNRPYFSTYDALSVNTRASAAQRIGTATGSSKYSAEWMGGDNSYRIRTDPRNASSLTVGLYGVRRVLTQSLPPFFTMYCMSPDATPHRPMARRQNHAPSNGPPPKSISNHAIALRSGFS